MRNFADVADRCTVTNISNGPVAMRHWADRIESLSPQPGAVVGEAAMELATAIRSGVRKGDRCTYFTKRGMEAIEKSIETLLRTLTNTDKGVV